MAWTNRNLLADYKNVLFTYDGTGMRLAKSTYVEIIDDDGTQRREITGTTTFDYEGDRLLSESRNGTPIRYVYGASGVIGFKYNGANYYYVRETFRATLLPFMMQVAIPRQNILMMLGVTAL